MDIYLLRHGKAEDADQGMSDRDRRLTPDGIDAIKEEIPGIKKKVERLDYILTSPFPRAEETALLVAEAFDLDDDIEYFEPLCQPDSEKEVFQRIAKFPEESAVMIVGHSPLLEELAEYLTGPGDAVALKKGGLCKIIFDGKPKPGDGDIDWVSKPKDLKEEA